MENAKKINHDITVATGQVTPEQLQQAPQEGFKSVMNLRSPDEEGFVSDEQQQVEAANLEYSNIPVKVEEMDIELVDRVLATIDELPKPILIHCKSGMRSGAMALMHEAKRQHLAPKTVFDKAKELGFDCDSHPQIKQFVQHYLSPEPLMTPAPFLEV